MKLILHIVAATLLLLLLPQIAASIELNTSGVVEINTSQDLIIAIPDKPYRHIVVPPCRGRLQITSSHTAVCTEGTGIETPNGSVIVGRAPCSLIYISGYSPQTNPCSDSSMDIYIPSEGGVYGGVAVVAAGVGRISIYPFREVRVFVAPNTSTTVSSVYNVSCRSVCGVVYGLEGVSVLPMGQVEVDVSTAVNIFSNFTVNPLLAAISIVMDVAGSAALLVFYTIPAALHIARRSPLLTATATAVVSLAILAVTSSTTVRMVSAAAMAVAIAASIISLARGGEV